MTQRYFVDAELASDQTMSISGSEAHHLLNVMRARQGDPVQLFNGKGFQAQAHVIKLERRSVTVAVDTTTYCDKRPEQRILVAAAMPKGDRFRFLLEKLTELGATAWVPLESQHAVNVLTPSLLKKAHQWVIDACKQCTRNHLLELRAPAPLPQLLDETAHVPIRQILAAPQDEPSTNNDNPTTAGSGSREPSASLPANPALASVEVPSKSTGSNAVSPWEFDHLVIIGPEGGFSETEFEQACHAGCVPLRIGQSVLRIETAAVAAVTLALAPKPNSPGDMTPNS